ncbi:hypothetical protein SAMN05216469_103262 [Ruminococcus albus]|uniref:Uncharacterized protein n=1 Tax=Ruminococcus albus TaxID=1264 RepID=A0A1H7I6M6_RUMAL|nr:hypothetical protein SAMN05216469_103262 [Ruminococcus albus]
MNTVYFKFYTFHSVTVDSRVYLMIQYLQKKYTEKVDNSRYLYISNRYKRGETNAIYTTFKYLR